MPTVAAQHSRGVKSTEIRTITGVKVLADATGWPGADQLENTPSFVSIIAYNHNISRRQQRGRVVSAPAPAPAAVVIVSCAITGSSAGAPAFFVWVSMNTPGMTTLSPFFPLPRSLNLPSLCPFSIPSITFHRIRSCARRR